MSALANLEARMARADYQPILAAPAVIARTLKVARSTVSKWGERAEHTGVHRYGHLYDVNECARWVLRRDQDAAARRAAKRPASAR